MNFFNSKPFLSIELQFLVFDNRIATAQVGNFCFNFSKSGLFCLLITYSKQKSSDSWIMTN